MAGNNRFATAGDTNQREAIRQIAYGAGPALPGILARLALGGGLSFHVGAQDSVDAGLVSAAVFLQPLHNVVVNPDCEAVLGFGHSEPCGLPEGFTELGDVGEVDVGIAHCAQPLKVRSSLCPSS